MRAPAALTTLAAIAAAVAAALAACDSHLEAKVGGAVLAQAFNVIPAPPAPVVVVKKGRTPAPLPAGPVRVAIDLATPWAEVHPLLDGGVAGGSQPILLVGVRHRVRGFVLEDAREPGPAIKLDANAAGTFCLSPPGVEQAYCVESGDHRHISSMYVREAVSKAVAAYGLTRIRVRPTDDLAWGDLVRVVDGARSCCPQPVTVTVAR